MLVAGGVVALPTETFYGLAACCQNRGAVGRVARLKRRPDGMPLLLLVDGVDRVGPLTKNMPLLAHRLIERFWPGPLTLVLPAARSLPPELLGPDGTVAVRHSSHPFPCAVVAALGQAITGTSANVSGADPARRPEQIALSDDERLDGLVDAGETAGGPPSTLVRVQADTARVLRPGAVTREALREAVGNRLL